MTRDATAAIPSRNRFRRAALGRIGHAIIVLWLTVTITFLLLYIVPGDAALARLGEAMGLNRPLYAHYAGQLFSTFTGDLGTSLRTGEPVLEMIAAAVTHRYWLRNFPLSIPSFFIAVPTFWTGLMLLLIEDVRRLGHDLYASLGVDAARDPLLPTVF